MKNAFTIFFVVICLLIMHNNAADAAWLKIINESQYDARIGTAKIHHWSRGSTGTDARAYYTSKIIKSGETYKYDPPALWEAHWAEIGICLCNDDGWCAEAYNRKYDFTTSNYHITIKITDTDNKQPNTYWAQFDITTY